MITHISCFCDKYNGSLLSFITRCYLLLACFPLAIMYISVQNPILILPITKTICSKHVNNGTKIPK